jgi:pimeloyl-ACP methyl ester carboxylesterase
MRLGVGVVVVLVAAGALAGAGGARQSWDGCSPRAGDIRFRAQDGTRLVGHLYGRGHAAVVLAHGHPGNLCQWDSYAKRLARRGYRVLAFDFRNHGRSQTRSGPNSRYATDLAAAVRVVRKTGARKVVLVGASFGGSAVLPAAVLVHPLVDGVVSVSGAADFLGAIDAAPHVTVPILYLVGRYDRYPNDVQRLYDATASADKTLKVLERGEHGAGLVGASPAARRLIAGFIAAH